MKYLNAYKLVLHICLVLTSIFVALKVNAAISLDRTRIIFNGSQDTMTVNLSNDNKVLPYLAQSWLEDEKGKKMVAGDLIITPPVQRIEAGSKSRVLITRTASKEKLPQDRESIYYFNVREIPPKSEKANVLQIALQTRVKLFYRPEGIQAEPNAVWQDQLIFTENNDGYEVNNPTPYFITVIALSGNKNALYDNKFESFMIYLKSKMNIKSKHYNKFTISYINDYGGRPTVDFICKNKKCNAIAINK